MIKEPRVGRVKTRLGRDIGQIAATWWFRHQSARLIRRLRDPRWQIILAVTPDLAVTARVWPADIARHPQRHGDLGQRMARLLRHFGHPGINPGPVCLIGADIPGISRAHIARSFAALGAHDVVFGPAMDGGYWLIGAKHPRRLPPNLLSGVRWSSPQALADSIRSLPGQRIALIDQLRDVDTSADLRCG
nr:TIGR04282 family arsenosugar biosynthesis glycosyltransferase [Pseudophaeobacter flagellatus]